MSQNRNKYFQSQIDGKSTTYALSEMPNPKQVKEGTLFYVKDKGLYVKMDGEFTLISSSQGNLTVKTNKVINSAYYNGTDNTYSIRLSHIVEFFSQEYVTLSQQYGQIIDSIKIPIDFTKINGIICYVTVTDGIDLVQKYVDKLSGQMNVSENNSLEMAFKYENYKLKLRIKEQNNYFSDLRTSYFSGKVLLNDGTNSLPDLRTVYTNNKLVMFLEMLVNVS